MEYIIFGIILGAAVAYVLWYIRDKIRKLP